MIIFPVIDTQATQVTMERFNVILAIVSVGVLCVISCSKSDDDKKPTPDPEPDSSVYMAENAFPNLSFSEPVDLQNAGDQSNRLFVVERSGIITVFANDSAATYKSTFLDITSKVQSHGDEQGLLGLAFHPNYKSNGYFYVNYTATNPERTVISRFKVSGSDANTADGGSELVVLEYPQPYENHNGGQIVFGPDHYLYIAAGDGGSGGDPHDNGQDRTALLGKILRIDVDHRQGDKVYAIPSDNPFAGNNSGYKEEIYAYGLRNPWRFSFDSDNGKLWAGDVGQNAYEEIDIIEKGSNYGWNTMEGKHCYGAATCDQTGLSLPVWDYPRNQGVSVIGGHVYRGTKLPGLTGLYIYTDYGSKHVWKLDATDTAIP